MTASSPPRILALDQSTTAVGWVTADGDGYLSSGTFRPVGNCAHDRIRQIGVWLEQMVADWQPRLLVAEDPAGDHNNNRSDRLLGMVLGVIMERARCAGIRLLIIHPMRVKATGLCKDDRPAAAAWVGKPRVGGDEADAIGLWQAALVPAWTAERAA